MDNLILDISDLEPMKSDNDALIDVAFKAARVLLHDGEVIVERRYTNAPPDRVHTITSVNEWNTFCNSFFV